MEELQFSNGRKIPLVGLGTWNSTPGEVRQAVKAALEVGYRFFDCAALYGNEKEIGDGLEEGMKTLGIKREDVVVSSKVWCTFMRPELVGKACQKTLSDLRLSYLDLYLVHWPVALQPGNGPFPLTSDGSAFAIDDSVLLTDTWKAMEKLVDEGLVKSIGISNFNHHQIEKILSNCRIKPVNLQIEVHADFPNTKLVEYAQSKGLTVTAYAPLGSPPKSVDQPNSLCEGPNMFLCGGQRNLFTEPWVTAIAEKYNKTPAQVLLRWLVQRKIIVIPKSVRLARMKENAQIFDFNLTPDEMCIMQTSGLNKRQFDPIGMRAHPEYPFNDEY
ncbi:unnamed protein product [Calicophoron daubneyi]|uniref:NADP-dependent oxidoreductase domain-containing protein n=1 Tax=Calicophoron daubneyi TaxID=300641 RepID=A0AAV2T3X2_CALDB